MSTPLHVLKSEFWIRVILAIDHCVRKALVRVLHNIDNDVTYQGLPQDPGFLVFSYFTDTSLSKKASLFQKSL